MNTMKIDIPINFDDKGCGKMQISGPHTLGDGYSSRTCYILHLWVGKYPAEDVKSDIEIELGMSTLMGLKNACSAAIIATRRDDI